MPFPPRLRALLVRLGRAIVFATAFILILVGLGIVVLETGWAKNQLRRVIVRQANQYLTATLDIGRLEGSLVRGIQLGDIRLSRNGRTLITIDDVSLTYSLRELFQQGVVIKRIRIARPHVVMSRTAEGRWDLATLVKREAQEQKRTGPGRPIEIDQIEVYDGSVTLNAPLDFGAAHAPTRYEGLNVTGAFAYAPVRWRLTFANVSFRGSDPDLTVNELHGGIENGPGGIVFHDLAVRTPTTRFTLAGPIQRDDSPAVLDLRLHAERFAFQEWAGVLHGLKDIAVVAAFDTSVKGPLRHLATDLRLQSTAGSIAGSFVLDTTVPGWHGTGAVDVGRLDLDGWLNRRDRPSDITGRVTFDLALELGHHFPRGSYAFSGPHVSFMEYAADNLRAHGVVTAVEAQIAHATARAYGADVTTDAGAIGIDAPFPFRFRGTTTRLDLRRVPASVPVPRVESTLAFDYDVTGQFADGFIAGRARFDRSQFLGAVLEPGTVGTIDTRAQPLRYSGEGDVHAVDVHRIGVGLDVGWMQDPRYAGVVAGHFRVNGVGKDPTQLELTASGRLERADLFHGRLSDANVALDIRRGTLSTSYDGRFAGIDPAIPLADARLEASLTGAANVRMTVRDLLTRTPDAEDYDIDGAVTLGRSEVRGVAIDRARIDGRFHDRAAELACLEVSGPAIEGHGAGRVSVTRQGTSDFQYHIDRAELPQLTPITGRELGGRLATTGRMSGPGDAVRLAGTATINQFAASGIQALTMAGDYDVTIRSGMTGPPEGGPYGGRVTGHASFLSVFGQAVETADGTITFADDRLGFNLRVTGATQRSGSATGVVHLHAGERALDLESLDVTLDHAPWRLARGGQPAAVSWNDEGIAVAPLQLVFVGDVSQRIGVSGTWRHDGRGALKITATHLFLETLQGALEQPARYGGVLDLDATLRGTRDAPLLTGDLTIANGRVYRVPYQRFAARVEYANGLFHVEARLDQTSSAWLTARGSLPPRLFDNASPERPIDLVVKSSPIDLAVIEGLTDVVRNVSGEMLLDVHVIGTSRDPHLDGRVDIGRAAFLVAATGSRYKNGTAAIRLARDRITVEALHLDDSNGRPLDVHGSLATHELAAGSLEIDGTARRFEVVHNAFGRVDVDSTLHLSGRFETPRLVGDITINGGDLKVDAILERTAFQPYATQPVVLGKLDAVAALNPWDRLGLDVWLHVPESLKLTGENLQVTPGTPIGLGGINLRVGGDLYLYKDPGRPLSVTGSLDSISGTYAFQGRRFDVDEASSINFRGDLNPEIYVSVTRSISGVLARVTLTGPLQNPELLLSSTPPLESSDILSLIVFNASMNDLSAAQQQELVVRAGALAAGFVAAPLLSAIEGALGLSVLEIEPSGEFGTGPKVTVGQEIAPGLVARFSRQFGQEPYDEAMVEYYLSRILRIRATFSDAGSLIAVSPFRRIERAGIDLLVFFSF